jgi:hypothetical protein
LGLFNKNDANQRKIEANFLKFHDKLEKLDGKINSLHDLIKHTAALTRIHRYLIDLRTLIDQHKNYVEKKNLYEQEMIDNKGDIYMNIKGIYSSLTDSFSTTILVSLCEVTNGDYKKMKLQKSYLLGLLAEGHMAYSTACVLWDINKNRNASLSEEEKAEVLKYYWMKSLTC